MKLRKLLLIAPLVVTATTLIGCATQEEKEQEEAKLAYYDDIDLDETGYSLEYALAEQCFKKHKVYIKYGQWSAYCSSTSKYGSIENVPGTKNNEYFYTGKKAKGSGSREHVWPCANSAQLWVHAGGSGGTHDVDKSTYIGGGSDLYHVRSCTSSVNTARGNSKYVDFDDSDFDSLRDNLNTIGDGGPYKLTYSGTEKFGTLSEPDDNFKGDVSRILLYVWLHYKERGLAPDKYKYMCGNLDFQQVLGYGSQEECVKKLVEWNEMDPPSKVEKQRNQTIQQIQGNRNPFVDYPEIARQIFEDDYELD